MTILPGRYTPGGSRKIHSRGIPEGHSPSENEYQKSASGQAQVSECHSRINPLPVPDCFSFKGIQHLKEPFLSCMGCPQL
jgi:hypothetical protein